MTGLVLDMFSAGIAFRYGLMLMVEYLDWHREMVNGRW